MDVAYLDYNASAPLPKELLCEVDPLILKTFGNPSSLHTSGRASRKLINDATEVVSHVTQSMPQNIYWTSSGSEANTWVFHSIAAHTEKAFGRKPRFLISSIEHESVQLSAKRLGGEVHLIDTAQDGCVNMQHLRELLHNHPFDLVSVMAINNETGVIQPISEMSSLCLEKGVPLHIDCVQALGKIPISIKKWNASYLTFSGHKLGAPKGTGFVITNNTLVPLIDGKQQKGLRGGTENPFGVSLVGKILKFNEAQPIFPEHLTLWHRDFEAMLKKLISGTIIHGENAPRAGNTSFVGFTGTDGDGILMNLDLSGVCASSGSACSSGSINPSHVLMAMGCDKALARASVRFSSGNDTKWADFEKVLNILPDIVQRVRRKPGDF